MDRKTDALIDRPMKDRPIDGWTNGQIDRLTDRQIDEQTNP